MPASSSVSRVSIRSAILQLDEAAHLGRALVEQVAREVEAERRLLQRQPLLDAPVARRDQRRQLGARAVAVAIVEHGVEQAALVGVRGLRLGPVEGDADARQQRRAAGVDAVEGAGLDQRLDDAAVDPAAIDAGAEIEQARERPARFARGDDRLDRALPRALDRAEAVANARRRHRLEAVGAGVDVGRLDRHAEGAGVEQQRLQLVAVVDFDRHVGGEELGREVDLDPGRVVREQRIRGGVRLVEAVAGELLHQVEDFVGDLGADALLGRAVAKDRAVRRHLLGLLLAHRLAQQVGAAERVAAEDLRGLHHLLLVDHDPVGLAEHGLEQRMRIAHLLAAVLAVAEARDVLHRPGPEHRVERDQVLEAVRLGVLQHAPHAAAFELEHRLGAAFGEQRVDLGVVERQRRRSRSRAARDGGRR